MLLRSLLTTAFLASSCYAQQIAQIVIEASHGGAGNDLTNTTVTIGINKLYTNTSTLAEVSTLYLIGSANVPIDSITCTPFKNADGTGTAGLPFDASQPSFISTNDVPLGSIVCITTAIMSAPPGGGLQNGPGALSSSSSGATTPTPLATTAADPVSSTLLTSSKGRVTLHASPTTDPATAQAASVSASASASASASPAGTTDSSASALYLFSGEFFGVLALAGFGFAFVL